MSANEKITSGAHIRLVLFNYLKDKMTKYFYPRPVSTPVLVLVQDKAVQNYTPSTKEITVTVI